MSEDLIPTEENTKKFRFQIAWKDREFKRIRTRIAQLVNDNRIDAPTKMRWNDAAQKLNQALSQAQQVLERADGDYKNDDSKGDKQTLEEWAALKAPQLRNAVQVLDQRYQVMRQISLLVQDGELQKLLWGKMGYTG